MWWKQGWEKLVFFKKTTHLLFIWKAIFGVFKKKQDFVLFSKKTEKAHSELFFAIMQYHHFQNYTIITCYTYHGIQNWG